ncbi:hypothetical protein LAZ67_20001407 [Cordylochernes scorpioides]|uniref:Uncharacterized protein n=1 Tax=Cordylochernes scorpioides TaxID=51811 RepID=A0ABY6LLN7_9ARAC|nr:hypothetical protein LAZ67_20001407 [Cordylochernes scorpioides]
MKGRRYATLDELCRLPPRLHGRVDIEVRFASGRRKSAPVRKTPRPRRRYQMPCIPPELKKHYNPFPDVQKARQLAFSRTQLKHERDKQRYDKGHQAPHFEIGDLVLVKNYKHPDTGSLAPYFTGPFTIIEIISPNVVRINRRNRSLNKKDDTVHVDKLKYYTENILFLAHSPLIQTPCITPDVEYNHLGPTIFDAQKSHLIPPTCSAPFLHLTAEIFQ